MGWEVRRADARTMGKQERVMLKRGGEGRWRGEGARANTACSSKRGVMPLTPTHAETEADGDGDGGRLLVLLRWWRRGTEIGGKGADAIQAGYL